MRTPKRVVAVLLLLLHGMTTTTLPAASPRVNDSVFTPDETAQLDSLRDCMVRYQEEGNYESAFRTGQTYNRLYNYLQQKALSQEQRDHHVLIFTFILMAVVICLLCLVYLYNLQRNLRRLNMERLRAEEILAQAKSDNDLQNRFLRRLDYGIRLPVDHIIHHSAVIFDPTPDTPADARRESRDALKGEVRQLLQLVDASILECMEETNHEEETENTLGTPVSQRDAEDRNIARLARQAPGLMQVSPNLFRSVLIVLAMGFAFSLPVHSAANAWEAETEWLATLSSMGFSLPSDPDHSQYCYREDGIEAHEPMSYDLDMMLYEEQQSTHQREFLLVVTALLVAFVIYLFIQVCTSRRNARMWQQRKEEVDRAIVLAQEARARKIHFMEHISHELRTPLNAIIGFSDVLTDETLAQALDEPEREECRKRGRQGTQELRELVDGSLELCAIATCRQKVNLQPTNLCALIDEVHDKYQAHLPQGVTFYVQFEEASSDRYVVKTDGVLLRRALALLMDNACKFTHQGQITLAARPAGKGMEISVEDTGIGVPPEKAEVIFRHFEKLDEFVPGIGLGLSLCRAILRLLGGEVKLDTAYTGGARFVVSLA
jgi:signal transduction histidine kinase